ncbi:MAG: hypothetical protein ABL888_13640 [Pirellulaceae bacterium]
MQQFISVFATILVLFANVQLRADVIASSFSNSTFAQFKTLTDSDSSISSVGTITSFVTIDNSFTRSLLQWSWGGRFLTGESTLTAEKTIAARPGGAHLATSSFIFQFTTDSAMVLDMAGTWGFNPVTTPGGDSITMTLVGSSGTLYSDSTSLNTGLTSDNFGYLATIAPDSYTLTISGTLTETINNAASAQGAWAFQRFSIAVPEPSVGIGLLLYLMAIVGRFRLRVATP